MCQVRIFPSSSRYIVTCLFLFLADFFLGRNSALKPVCIFVISRFKDSILWPNSLALVSAVSLNRLFNRTILLLIFQRHWLLQYFCCQAAVRNISPQLKHLLGNILPSVMSRRNIIANDDSRLPPAPPLQRGPPPKNPTTPHAARN